MRKNIYKSVIMLLVMILSLTSFTVVVNAEESVDSISVYITVSDITDYTHPLDILVPRTELQVSEFDLSQYGSTLSQINTIEGITYLHALVQLHINLYGEDISDKLLLDEDGVTRYFMGRQTANVMYKNGNDIAALPQNISIHEGDEIQVCLYNSSYSQGIATFSNASVTGNVDEPISLSLYEHFDSPRNREGLEDAEIVDQDGLYYTDSEGNIVTTDSNGSFNLTFNDPGTYTVSMMPQINYYMQPSDGGYTTVYEKLTTVTPVQTEFKTITGRKLTEKTVAEAITDFRSITGDASFMIDGDMIYFLLWEEWPYSDSIAEDEMDTYIQLIKDADSSEGWTISGYDPTYDITYHTEYVKETTLVEKQVPTSDEMLPAVSYTIPYCTVNVTADFSADAPDCWFMEDTSAYDSFTITLHNSRFVSDAAQAIAASYDSTGKLLSIQQKSIKDQTSVSYSFGKGADTYKVFFWDSLNDMIPIHTALVGTH